MAKRDRPVIPVTGLWDEEQSGLWLGGDDTPPKPDGHARTRRRLAVASAAVVCLAVVGVPVGLVLASGGPNTTARHHSAQHGSHVSHAVHLGNGPAEHQVLSALSATTASGSFNVAYRLTEAPGSVPDTTTTTCVSVYSGVSGGPGALSQVPVIGSIGTSSGGAPVTTVTRACGGGSGPDNASVSGQGTIDVNPMAMAVSADVSTFGDLSVRVNDTDLWELGGGDYGLSPKSTDSGPGSSLSGFAGLAEGTLGQREGAIAMMGMASPTGFLDLSQAAVTGAAEVGTGNVGGVPVTEYQVSIDLSQLAQAAGASTEETKTLQGALGVLHQEGYSGTMVKLAIDNAGFIREATPVASFADGGTVTLDATFSNFGCAGTVLMPGQQATTTSTAGCTSPDVTTTTVPSASTTTTGASTTTTGTSTTTTAAATTTTGAATTTTG
jgi:hypothetical protein